MMNLNDFFCYTEDEVYDQGFNYSIEKKIRIFETMELTYEADILNHHVWIDLDDYYDIVHHECTCSDNDELCVHQVAVLCKLDSILNG